MTIFEGMRLVELEPLDTLFFGDNKGMEFNFGGISLEMPLPWTVSGALLFKYVSETGRISDVRKGCLNGGECEQEERGEATEFAFYGPFISFGTSLWFPPPADLIRREGSRDIDIITPKARYGGYSSFMPSVYLPYGWETYNEFVDHVFMEKYAEGIIEKPKRPPKVYKERRVGIHIDDSRRAVKTGFTFSSTHIRPPFGMKYAVLVSRKDGNNIDFSGLVRIGGEGRPAKVSTRDWKPSWLKARKLRAGKVVKVVLLSPAIYRLDGKNVRLPDLAGLPGNPELCRIGESDLVIGGKPMRVSGWNSITKRARKMYTAVPSGTVYYLKLREDVDRLDLTSSFWKLSSFWERGFGSPLISLGGVECE